MNFGEILGIVLALASGILTYVGWRKTNESHTLSRYVPADTINSIPFEVPVVITGTVNADQPLISPVTKKPCVYYKYTLEREEETKTKAGNSVWEWKQVGSVQLQTTPFYLQDTSGKILIKPDNCEVHGIYRTQQFLEPGTIQNVSTGLKALAEAFQFDNLNLNVEGNRERVTEDTIFTGATINIFGILAMEGEQKIIQSTKEYPLVLSPLSKEQLVNSEKKSAYFFYAIAALLLIVGLIIMYNK